MRYLISNLTDHPFYYWRIKSFNGRVYKCCISISEAEDVLLLYQKLLKNEI